MTRLKAEDIQAEIMAFADSYTAIMSQASDRTAERIPDRRAAIHDAKLRNVQNAINIAAGANPVGGLLDMTVMVSLQRQVVEEYWIPESWGDAGLPLLEGLQLLEQEIWLIADRALDEEEVEALRALIPQIRERFRGQVLVSSIRASDFAEDRRATVANLKGGGSLLRLFQVDPLAGLSPAAQELAQSRLLAERAFFWAMRLPLILNWQIQDIILETLAEPETQKIVDATVRLTESSRRLSAAAEELSQRLPQERDAAIEQLAALTAAEREAALKQAFEGIATEREAILRTFEQEDERLRGLLGELRQIIESTTALSASLTTTIESTERLRAGFSRPPGEPRREGRPFDVADYRATAEATTATVEELNRLIVSLTELMASPDWEERNSQLAAATDRAQTTLEQLIDRSYRRGLVLIGVLIVGALAAALVYRGVAVRLLAARSGRAV
ncbi:MAG: hypothetical protein ACYS0G_09870 [Planctomycetota bacterium]